MPSTLDRPAPLSPPDPRTPTSARSIALADTNQAQFWIVATRDELEALLRGRVSAPVRVQIEWRLQPDARAASLAGE